MDRLRCAEEELEDAVRAVMVIVSAVEDFIEKKKRG
jgi:hypothetical protein